MAGPSAAQKRAGSAEAAAAVQAAAAGLAGSHTARPALMGEAVKNTMARKMAPCVWGVRQVRRHQK